MDGFHVFEPASSLRGVLFADDFDLADPPEPAPPPEEPPLPPPVYSQAELEAARRDGYSSGRADAALDFAAQQESSAAATLVRIAALLRDSRDSVRERLDASAEAVAGVVLAALSTLFPIAAAQSGVEEILPRIRHLFRGQIPPADLQVAVAPDLQARLEQALAHQAAGLPEIRVVARLDLLPGDAEISWVGGMARQDHAAARQAIQGILEKLNLAPPPAPAVTTRPHTHLAPTPHIATTGRFDTEDLHAG